jgi:hypothetical protein
MSSFYDLASLVMIPSGKKAGKVYSQKPLTTDGQLDFTRASTATRIGSDGLIEKTRTNLLLQSNTFSTTWINSNTSETSGQAGYDGTNNAWLLDKSAASGYIQQSISLGNIQTFSVYAKKGTLNWMRIIGIGTSVASTWFDLENGVVGSADFFTVDSNIQSVGNGWYRCSITYSVGTIGGVRIYPSQNNNNVSGTSGNIYIQSAQLEQGLVATSYIPTTTAAVSVGSVDNMPRLNYTPGSTTSCPSLLLEPQRTNITTQSEYLADIGAWSRVRADVEPNTLISPDGTQNASTLSCTDFSETYIQDNVPIGTTTGTFSFFAKKGNLDYCHSLVWDLSASGRRQWFNLATGQVGTSTAFGTDYDKVDAGMEDYGNGWYRCWFAWANGNNNSAVRVNNSNGDGSTNAAVNTFNYFYGCQTEAGVSYKTSYIPTFGATVTRVQDACSKTGISGLIGQTEGTFFAELNISSNDGTFKFLSLSDGTVDNVVWIYYRSGANQINFRVIKSGNSQFDQIYSAADVTINHKVAIKYKENDFSAWFNGTKVLTDTSGSTFSGSTLSTFNTFRPAYLDNHFVGDIKKVIVFPTALTDTQLADLTSIDS